MYLCTYDPNRYLSIGFPPKDSSSPRLRFNRAAIDRLICPPLPGNGVAVAKLGKSKGAELGHQNRGLQGHDAVHLGVLSEHKSILLTDNGCGVGVKSHMNQGIRRVIAEQRRWQNPKGRATILGRRVSNME